MRTLSALMCLGLATLCALGFAATLEPLERDVRLPWQVGYGLGFAAAMLGLAWVLFRRRG